MPSKPHQNEVGRSNSGRASSFRSISFKKIHCVLGFCCIDFATSTKTNLEMKIDQDGKSNLPQICLVQINTLQI